MKTIIFTIPNIILLFLACQLTFAETPDQYYKMAKKAKKTSLNEALEYYSKAIQYSDITWKKRAKCFFEKAMILYEMNEIELALTDFVSSLSMDGSIYEAHKYTAKCCFKINKYSQALDELEKAEEMKASDGEINYLRGRIMLDIYKMGGNLMQENNLHASVKEFTSAIEKEWRYYQAYFYRGVAYQTANAYDEAIKDFEKAIKIKEDLFSAWYELARSNIILKRNIKSIEALEKCLKYKKNHRDALQMIIDLSMQSNFPEKIDRFLKQALEYYPKDPDFRELNKTYKAVPEENLPVIEEPKTAKQKQTKKEPEISLKKPEATWLEIPDDLGKVPAKQPEQKTEQTQPAEAPSEELKIDFQKTTPASDKSNNHNIKSFEKKDIWY